MQTFRRALIDLVVTGQIDREVAANASSNRHDFLIALEHALKEQHVDRQIAEAEAEGRAIAIELPELRLAARGE
jgi:hypothetical protein